MASKARSKPKTTKSDVIKFLREQNPTLSKADLERITGASPGMALTTLGKIDVDHNIAKLFKEHKEAIFNQTSARMISSIRDDEIQKLPVNLRIWSAAVMDDKAFRAATGGVQRIDVRVLQASVSLSSDEIDLLRKFGKADD